jgi:hypothetical protein
LIITGANSKRQPELATFEEKVAGQEFHMPLSSRLEMADSGDRLSLAYNTFFVDVYPSVTQNNSLTLRFVISGKGKPPDEARLNLQLCLKAGEALETGTGRKFTLSADRIDVSPEVLGGSVHLQGWTLNADPAARLSWPVYPYNPYADAPESTLEHAVGVLSVPIVLKNDNGRFIRPHEQEISLTLEAR